MNIKLRVYRLDPVMHKCDALVDQNRYIGNDPVGHACWSEAKVFTDSGHLLCLSCEALLPTGRITLSPSRYREAEYLT
jgi:hypothetical protein